MQKNGSVKDPDLYLGADVPEWFMANKESEYPRKVQWALLGTKYTKCAISEL
jgi:hypothetical protein